jgi:hypothetical protein
VSLRPVAVDGVIVMPRSGCGLQHKPGRHIVESDCRQHRRRVFGAS